MSGAVEGVALLPCPFCGSKHPQWVGSGDGNYVECGSCLATMPPHDPDVPNEVARWNTRTTPPARSYADEDVETQWEVWEDDLMVASSTDEGDARHYLAVYSQDGPVRLVKSVTVRTPCDPAPVLSHLTDQEGKNR